MKRTIKSSRITGLKTKKEIEKVIKMENETIIKLYAIVEEMHNRIPTIVSINNHLYELKKETREEPQKTKIIPYLKSIVCFIARNQYESISLEIIKKQLPKARENDIRKTISYLIEQHALVQISSTNFKVLPKLHEIHRKKWG